MKSEIKEQVFLPGVVTGSQVTVFRIARSGRVSLGPSLARVTTQNGFFFYPFGSSFALDAREIKDKGALFESCSPHPFLGVNRLKASLRTPNRVQQWSSGQNPGVSSGSMKRVTGLSIWSHAKTLADPGVEGMAVAGHQLAQTSICIKLSKRDCERDSAPEGLVRFLSWTDQTPNKVAAYAVRLSQGEEQT